MAPIKAVAHVHSEWSYDAKWTLSELASAFRKRGFRILLTTEHDRGFTTDKLREYRETARAASSDDLLIVPGIEYSDAENVVHTLTWGDAEFLGENLDTREVLEKIAEAGGASVMAHPSRKQAWRNYQESWTPLLSGIEVWNRKSDGWRPSEPAFRLVEETGLPATVGPDFHRARQFFPLALWLDLEGKPTEAKVTGCLREQRFKAKSFGVDAMEFRSGFPARIAGSAEAFRRLVLRKQPLTDGSGD